jgi:hypothetical protein
MNVDIFSRFIATIIPDSWLWDRQSLKSNLLNLYLNSNWKTKPSYRYHNIIRACITYSVCFFPPLHSLHSSTTKHHHTFNKNLDLTAGSKQLTHQPEKILFKFVTMTASRHVSLITLNTAIHGIQHMAAWLQLEWLLSVCIWWRHTLTNL